jgi:signal transduction histidine kinase
MLEDEELTLTPDRVHIIMGEIEQLRRLVGDLSLLSTADAKELQMQIEVVDVQELLEKVRQSHLAAAEKNGKQISVSAETDTLELRVDPGRMTQVLNNLVENALRYTSSGGVIRLSAGHVDDMVEIRVQDNGKGIAPEDLPYVFDRFYQADKARSETSGKQVWAIDCQGAGTGPGRKTYQSNRMKFSPALPSCCASNLPDRAVILRLFASNFTIFLICASCILKSFPIKL